jgi:signal transduction histidine kinase
VRVLVVDDHAGFRAALRRLLERELEHDVVGEAADGLEALHLAEREQPDLVLLDVRLPGLAGPDAARAVREVAPAARIVALTASADPPVVAAMLGAGADSYLVKTVPTAELVGALRRIAAGEVVMAPEVLPVVVAELAQRLQAEHQRAEALAALDRAKHEFLSLVSDRLSTPLTAIAGYTKTLREQWDRLDDGTKQEFVAALDRQCDRLGDRIEQMTTVVRLRERGGDAAVPFSLAALAREVLAHRGQLGGGRCLLAEGDAEVVGDRVAIWGVVRSLVDNAVTYTAGPVELRVRPEGAVGVLEVCDEGPGMAPEQVARHLREPFRTGDPSDASAHEGLGLSLYAAARVLRLFGGELRIESGRDRGTVASVRLPLAVMTARA